jgi:tyrosyl-tRNA synthetase
VSILRLLTETGLASSNGEARRLIDQGGVSIDGVRITDSNTTIPLSTGVIVKVGKRKFLKVTKA